MNLSDIETIELLPAAALSRTAEVPQAHRPQFVLLHDAGGAARVMLELGHVLGDAFADAAVLMDRAVTRLQTCVPLRFWKGL